MIASDPNLRNIQERIQGYYEALQEAGLHEFKDVLVIGHNNSGAVPPDAVIAVLSQISCIRA